MDYNRPPAPKKKRDNVYYGAFLGLTFPIVGFLFLYILFFADAMTLPQYFDSIFTNRTASGVLALSLILNLFVFFLNIWNNKMETAKGIVGMTMFYGIMVIIFKFA